MGIISYIRLAGFILILAAIGSAYWYYTWSQKEIQVLKANNQTLEISLQQSEAANAKIRESIAQMQNQLVTTNKRFTALRNEYQVVSNKLSKHDIGYLASKKPGLMENIFNEGTSNINRCFELATGAKHTEAELNATKRSEINTGCPALANPNYREAQ